MKHILAIAGVIVASLVLGGLAVVWLVWPMLSSSDIRHAVARDTGLTVTFAGSGRLSLWPEPAIEFKDVVLSNPAGMSEGRFAAAESVRLKLSAHSLWRRRPAVREVVAVRPLINLLIDTEGRSNFAFDRFGGGEEPSLPPIVLVDGEVTYLNERSGAAFAVSNADLTLSRSGLDGPIELAGAFNWNAQRAIVALYARSPARLAGDGSPVDFTVTSPYLNAAFSGRAALKDGLELAGTMDFTAHSLADLLSWAGHTTAHTADLPPLTASGSLDLSGGAIRIASARVAFGRMNAQGDLTMSFTGARPRLTASLAADRIDLDQFAGDITGPAPSGLAADWSDAPIDVAFLKIMDAELSLAASEIVYGHLLAGPARLDVGLTNGTLDAALANAELYGGSASGRLRLDGSQGVAAITCTLIAKGINGGEFIAGFAGPDLIRGKADIELDLAAKGASQRELAAMLKGQARLSFAEGALIDVDVPAMLGQLAMGDIDGWATAAGAETRFASLAASFAVQDGIAETWDLSLSGPVAEIAGSGSVDALRRRLDLKLLPRIVARKPDSGEPASTPEPVMVVIEGSWSAPRIYRDGATTVDDPAEASGLDLAPGKVNKDPSEPAATR